MRRTRPVLSTFVVLMFSFTQLAMEVYGPPEDDMVLILAGQFRMGSNDKEAKNDES